MLYLSGVIIACFLDLLLLTKRNKTAADRILAVWLLMMAVHLLLFYFRTTGQVPQLLAADFPMPLVHGPLLYLYVQSLTNRTVPLKYSLFHFLPAAAMLLYLVPFFMLPLEDRIEVFRRQGAGYEAFNFMRRIGIVASGVAYVILSSVALRSHRRSIVQQFSYTEKINLHWLQFLTYWMGAIWVLVTFGNDGLIFPATVLFIFCIGFFGIRQAGIFSSDRASPPGPGPSVNLPIVEPDKPKYQKSGLTAEAAQGLHNDLVQVMATEKLFRNSQLSLANLADKLNTQPNYLSQVINELEGKNFYDYINTLRIEEFKRASAEPESRKYTLLALAQECGFTSKSSFNRYFRKVTGKSPSEFINTTGG